MYHWPHQVWWHDAYHSKTITWMLSYNCKWWITQRYLSIVQFIYFFFKICNFIAHRIHAYKLRLRLETQQDWARVYKQNTRYIKVWPKHKKLQAFQLCKSLTVPYKTVQVGLGYAKNKTYVTMSQRHEQFTTKNIQTSRSKSRGYLDSHTVNITITMMDKVLLRPL